MLIEQIKAANITAMKERDAVARGVLSVVLTRYKNQEVELRAQGKEIGDKELLSIIQKVLKELADEKEGYLKVNNQERADAIARQEEILSNYLPKQLSEQEIRDIINKIIHLNIDIEVCGNWIWCSGNTYSCKDELKANGFKWCSNKKMWAWHPADYIKKSRKSVSMNDIRNLYGSETIKESKKDDTKKLR